MMKVRNLGRKSLEEVLAKLSELGLSLSSGEEQKPRPAQAEGISKQGEKTQEVIIMAKYRKLGRSASQRKALIRAEVTNLLHHGKIITTEAKAKEIRKVAEKLIALAVRDSTSMHQNMLNVTVVTQESLRLLSVKVMQH